jgi:hypothetical protein
MAKQLYTKKEIVEYEPDFFTDGWSFSGTPQYVDSVYDVGVIQPVLLGKYRNKLYLIAGNRRILSYLAAVERAKDDGSFEKKLHLQTIDAVIYHGISPTNQAAFSMIENEERSDNPVATFKLIQLLKEQNKWDEVTELYTLNRGRLNKFAKYGKIDTEFLDAHLNGKIAKGNLEKIASLNSTRQAVLKQTLEKKGKLTYPDIREAKSTQVTKALKQMPSLPAIPLPQVEDEPDVQIFAIMHDNGVLAPTTFESLTEALITRQDGDRIFRLVEV